ncbi:MAG: DUF4421 family protein [Bacteroidales bacterium]|nr:DUF4421 family protein [Bacteroidales bacterium]
MKKLLLVLIALICCFQATAQRKFLKKVDDYLSKGYYKVNYDTAYIGRPVGTKWTAMVKPIFSYSQLDFSGIMIYHDDDTGEDEYVNFKSKLDSDINPKLSFSISYLGLSAGTGFSLNKVTGQGKKTDADFSLSSYGNSFGIEFAINYYKSFTGNYDYWDDSIHLRLIIPREFVSQITLDLDFYYAFNNKRFSYPAAFSQSYIQKKSAGSLLIGGSLHANEILAGDSTAGTEIFCLENYSLGIGVGYAYNLVINKHMLFHLSLLPYVVFDGGTSLRHLGKGELKGVKTDFPEMYVILRNAFIYNYKGWFFGTNLQLNQSYFKSGDAIKMTSTQWLASCFVGFRF